jgi:hypothetical protein
VVSSNWRIRGLETGDWGVLYQKKGMRNEGLDDGNPFHADEERYVGNLEDKLRLILVALPLQHQTKFEN